MKKHVLGACAIVLSIVLSAATVFKSESSTRSTYTIYEFVGSSSDDVGDPDLWEIITIGCSDTTGRICTVRFEGTLAEFRAFVEGKNQTEILASASISNPRFWGD